MPVDPFELVRQWFQAFNAGDLDALTALYHEDATNDSGAIVSQGRDAVRREIGAALDRSAHRHVRMIARVETGAMHAEWRGRDRNPQSGEIVTSAGYDEFWIESGRIRRQRGVVHPLDFHSEDEPVPSSAVRPSRQYPAQPIVGVGAVIIHDGRVVLVKRRYEPLAGQWSLPGGRLELGETLEAGLAREMLEETGLEVEVGPVVDVFDRILLDPERKVRYHYVLIDYLCRPVGGSLTHGSDVAAAEFVDPAHLDPYRLTPKATSVIEKAVAAARTHQWDRNAR
jgi:ADP-ribose pyrophosphatase YjhB (NUDIX family)/ketosteroid isomerase-like protein